MILLFAVSFYLGFSFNSNTPNLAGFSNDYGLAVNTRLADNSFSYEQERQNGNTYYALINDVNIIRGGKKDNLILKASIYDRQAQELYYEDFTIGYSKPMPDLRLSACMGLSLNKYLQPEPCFRGEAWYKKTNPCWFGNNPLNTLLQAFILSWSYEFRAIGMLARDRYIYGLNTLSKFNVSKMVGFAVEGSYMHFDHSKEYYKYGVNIFIDL